MAKQTNIHECDSKTMKVALACQVAAQDSLGNAQEECSALYVHIQSLRSWAWLETLKINKEHAIFVKSNIQPRKSNNVSLLRLMCLLHEAGLPHGSVLWNASMMYFARLQWRNSMSDSYEPICSLHTHH